jgi:hypothetical protein
MRGGGLPHRPKTALKLVAALVAMLVAGSGWSAETGAHADLIVVPPDYHARTQPTVFAGAVLLTAIRDSGSYQDKYKQIYRLLATDRKLIDEIRKVAGLYQIDPIHIIGAIVGEHTYNIDVVNTLDTYYVKALEYAGDHSLVFEYRGEKASALFARPQFARCETLASQYEVWDCRENVWNKSFFGKIVDGRLYPHDRLHRVFFRPMYAGQSFGLGQLSAVVALSVTDLVHKKSGLPLLSIDDAPEVYRQIMNPDTNIHYIAAEIRMSIDEYRKVAGFDISQNPGITATLYNLGGSASRAAQLKAINDQRKLKGEPPELPQENFYGWFVNEKLPELRKLLS